MIKTVKPPKISEGGSNSHVKIIDGELQGSKVFATEISTPVVAALPVPDGQHDIAIGLLDEHVSTRN